MKSMSWHGLGLRGRLFAAFGAVTATTVLASATAFVSYDRLGRSLEVAAALGCRTVAFPAISTGIYGYPIELAAGIAVASTRAALAHLPGIELVRFVKRHKVPVIAIAGIRLTARTQVGMGLIEYLILVAFSIAGLVVVLGHHHGTLPMTRAWLSLSGIGGQGSLASGLLIAVFMLAGWDATIYVNEEVKHRRHNPGRAAVIAVALLIVIYTFSQVGLQGAVSPAKLQANSSSVLVYIGQALGGGGGAKVMALALALSVIASTGVSIVIIARMVYGMANHRVLPPVLGLVSPRFATPVVASVVVGAVLIAVTWIYLLSSSIANAFTQLIDVTGVLYASFYILTALSAIVYYRRRIFSNAWDAVLVGILPLAAAVFLVWIVVKSTQNAPASQRWALFAIVGSGVLVMFVARLVLRSPFFQIPRESAPGEQ